MPDAHARRLGAVIGFGESFQVIQRASCHQRHPRPPPAGTAPPSLVLLRHPRRRLGYPRAHVGRPIFIECLLSNPTVQVFQRFQGARVRHEKKRWPLRGRKEIGNAAIAAQNSNPGFTEPTLPRKRSWQVSALFRPRPGRTRQLCRPLHSAALIRFAGYAERFAAFQRSQTVETGLRSGAPQGTPAGCREAPPDMNQQ